MKRILYLFLIIVLQSVSVTALPVQADTAPRRIISLAPATTEILFALGLGDRIIGVTSFCDYPKEAKLKPKVGGMSNPSLEAVVRAKPDIVVMTTDGNPKEFEARVRELGMRTYIFTARRISELPAAIREMGAVLGAGQKAIDLAGDIETSLAKIASNRGQGKAEQKQKALFVIWPEPFIVAGPGTAIDDAFHLLGIENIASGARSPYPKYSLEEVIHQAPDVIYVGQGRESMKEGADNLLKRIGSVPALRQRDVCYVSDKLYRLGPRIIPGIEELSECLR